MNHFFYYYEMPFNYEAIQACIFLVIFRCIRWYFSNILICSAGLVSSFRASVFDCERLLVFRILGERIFSNMCYQAIFYSESPQFDLVLSILWLRKFGYIVIYCSQLIRLYFRPFLFPYALELFFNFLFCSPLWVFFLV